MGCHAQSRSADCSMFTEQIGTYQKGMIMKSRFITVNSFSFQEVVVPAIDGRLCSDFL